MAKIYTLTKAAVRALQADHHRLRTQMQTLGENPLRGNNRTPQRDDLLIGKASGAVAARSGATMTSALFTVQAVSNTGVRTATAKPLAVYNVGGTAISSGDYLPIERDYRSGTWVARAPGAAGAAADGTTIVYVKAQEYWQHGGTLPSAGGAMAWISCKLCDRDGTGETGAAFDCYLPVPPHMDPNVVVSQVLSAAEIEDQSDSATSWSAVSDVSDLAVGSVKMMTGNNPTPEHGWVRMDGSQDTDRTAGGLQLNMAGRLPEANSLGTEKGTINASEFTSIVTPDTVTSSSTTPDTMTTSSTGVTVSITGSSVTTGTNTTGIESTDPADAGSIDVTTETINHDSGGPDETDVVTEVTVGDLEHSHTITETAHAHSVSGTFTGTADSHNHTVAGDPHTHQVPGDPHRHQIEHVATLGLYFFERIDNSAFDE